MDRSATRAVTRLAAIVPGTTLLACALIISVAAPARAGCSAVPLAQVQSLLDSFAIRPQRVLEMDPQGSTALVGQIRDMLATDPDTVTNPILSLLASANDGQKQAIGQGMALAARLCDRAEQPWRSRQWMQAVRGRQDRLVTIAFMTTYLSSPPPPSASPGSSGDVGRLGLGGAISPASNPFKPPALSDPFKPVK